MNPPNTNDITSEINALCFQLFERTLVLKRSAWTAQAGDFTGGQELQPMSVLKTLTRLRSTRHLGSCACISSRPAHMRSKMNAIEAFPGVFETAYLFERKEKRSNFKGSTCPIIRIREQKKTFLFRLWDQISFIQKNKGSDIPREGLVTDLFTPPAFYSFQLELSIPKR